MAKDVKKQLPIRDWLQSVKRAWLPPVKITTSQWAAKNFIVTDGPKKDMPFDISLTPYLKGPLDAFSDPEVEKIVEMFPVQSGKTLSEIIMLSYIVDCCPGPAMFTQASETNVRRFVKKRLIPMVKKNPVMWKHWSGKPWDLNSSEFEFDLMTLYFAWAGSAGLLASTPIQYVLIDEPDKYPRYAGHEENPVELVEWRVNSYVGFGSKIVIICTPTDKTGNIWLAWEDSNMQEYFCPCPHCGEFRAWKLNQLKVPPNLREPRLIIETKDVWYECEVCLTKIREWQKAEIVGYGIWCPAGQKVNKNGELEGLSLRPKRISGFHTTALVSPFGGVSWPRIMAKWFAANTQQGILLGKLKTFKNNILAEPWEEVGRKVEELELRKNVGEFSKGTVPDWCLILVAFADYHETERKEVRIDYEVRGFGYNLRNAVISSGSVSTWEQLDGETILNPFPWSNPANTKPMLAVMLMPVDSGFKPDEAYEYCRKRRGITIPTKGASNPQKAPVTVSDLEKSVAGRVKNASKYHGMQLLIIDTSFFKDVVTGWVENKKGGSQSTEFYKEIPDLYFKQFTNEHKVQGKDRSGRPMWKWKPISEGAETHSLDTAVGAAVAAYMKGVFYWRPPEEQRIVSAAAKGRATRDERPATRQGGFLNDLPSL